MVEAVMAIALMALCAGTVMGAVVLVQHQLAIATPSAELLSSAQNVLTDLRAATAYDAAALNALDGRSETFDIVEPAPGRSAQPLHISVRIARVSADAALVASISVRNARGQSVNIASTLVQEAPAPGSIVPAATPTPEP